MADEPIQAGIDMGNGSSDSVCHILLNGQPVATVADEESARKITALLECGDYVTGTLKAARDKGRLLVALKTDDGKEFEGDPVVYVDSKYKIPHIPYPNAKNWDALIPVPYHCLIRLLNAVSYSNLVGPGSALERDYLMTEEAIKDECERTKNVQGR